MINRLALITLCMSIAMGGISWGAGELQAQPAKPATANERAIMEAYRLKAERVQEMRKARITPAQREAAAERANLAREKAARNDKDAKGGAK